MQVSNEVWLLTEAGLLNIDGQAAIATPFQDKPVTAGDIRDGHVAVVVNDREIWICENEAWEKTAECEIRVNCLAWTQQGRLLAGTARARLGWVADHGVDFIEAFFSGGCAPMPVLDLSLTDFQKRACTELVKVPYGEVITYGDSRLGRGDRPCRQDNPSATALRCSARGGSCGR